MRPRTLPPPPPAPTTITTIIQSASKLCTVKGETLMSTAGTAGQKPTEKRLMGAEMLRQEVQVLGRKSLWSLRRLQ